MFLGKRKTSELNRTYTLVFLVFKFNYFTKSSDQSIMILLKLIFFIQIHIKICILQHTAVETDVYNFIQYRGPEWGCPVLCTYLISYMIVSFWPIFSNQLIFSRFSVNQLDFLLSVINNQLKLSINLSNLLNILLLSLIIIIINYYIYAVFEYLL